MRASLAAISRLLLRPDTKRSLLLAIAWCPCSLPTIPMTISLVSSHPSLILPHCSPCLRHQHARIPTRYSFQTGTPWNHQSRRSPCPRLTLLRPPDRPAILRWSVCRPHQSFLLRAPWRQSWLQPPLMRPRRRSERPNGLRTSSEQIQILRAADVTHLSKERKRPIPPRRNALPSLPRRNSRNPKVGAPLMSPNVFVLIFQSSVDVSKLDKTPEGLAIWPPLPAAASAPQVPNEVSLSFVTSSPNVY